MKTAIALACAALAATPALSVPQIASAQPYWGYDPCYAAKRHAATQGTVAGGAIGAVLGSAIAGRGSRLGGAIVGGTVGAVAGHEIGKSSVRCLNYPPRFRPHPNCHWIENDYGGRRHQYEICRGPDGRWGPSGRRY
jgi:hypothetical protein